jgi:hypothetical protein
LAIGKDEYAMTVVLTSMPMARNDRDLPPLPPESDQIAGWARRRRLGYEPRPTSKWFRKWEPYDTMVSADHYYNVVSWPVDGGMAAVAEPWIAPLDSEPLGRTVLFFVQHSGFTRRAAARGGEHFNTRVAYLENPPPPEVRLGDPAWDQHVLTFAASPAEALVAFPRPARQLLAHWGFVGHVEVRPGGLIFNQIGIEPNPSHLDGMIEGIQTLVRAFVSR